MTTLKPVMRIAHAVSVTGTRLAAPWKCSMTIWLIGDGQLLERLDQRVDRVVAQVGQEMRLPVVERAFRERRDRAGRSARCTEIGPIASMTGGPNALIGLTAASPSRSGPQWRPAMPTSLAPEPSGAVSSPATSIISSGSDAHVSRKKRSTFARRSAADARPDRR